MGQGTERAAGRRNEGTESTRLARCVATTLISGDAVVATCKAGGQWILIRGVTREGYDYVCRSHFYGSISFSKYAHNSQILITIPLLLAPPAKTIVALSLFLPLFLLAATSRSSLARDPAEALHVRNRGDKMGRRPPPIFACNDRSLATRVSLQ